MIGLFFCSFFLLRICSRNEDEQHVLAHYYAVGNSLLIIPSINTEKMWIYNIIEGSTVPRYPKELGRYYLLEYNALRPSRLRS
jgi:hypothetical protein